jgi:hypothetical protein
MLGTVKKTLHRVSVRCAPACTLLVDDKLTPWNEVDQAEVYLDPGAHVLAAGWSKDRQKSERVDATARGQGALSFEAPPLPPEKPPPPPVAPAPPPPPKRSGLPKAVFFVGAGVTAVVGAVTAWSAFDMWANPGKEKVRADCAGLDESCPTYQEGLSHQRRTNVLLVTTAGLAVATGVVGAFFTDWEGSSGDRTTGARPATVPVLAVGNGVTIGASGRF